MIITGEIIEVGTLEDESGALGICIDRGDASFVTITGLTEDETRQAAKHLYSLVTITLAGANGEAS